MRCKEKVVYAYLYGESRCDIIIVILPISPFGYAGRKILCSSRVFVCEKGVDNQKIDRKELFWRGGWGAAPDWTQ
jgi:hypothetical protein